MGSGQAGDDGKRDSLLSRISYLIDLLKKSPLEPIGGSASDALSAYSQQDPTLSQTILLLHYAHFCEEMPKVHKDYLQVQSIVDNHVVLEHATTEFSDSEAKDVILSELAGSVILSGLSRLDNVFDKLAMQSPTFDRVQMDFLLDALCQHFQRYVFDVDILTEAGFVTATGVNRDVFRRFRAALLAIADFCDGVAGALSRRLNADGPPSDQALADELLEWISVFWIEKDFREIVAGLARITPAELGKLLPFFFLNLDAAKLHADHAGDGFTPPLFQLGNGVSFTSSLIRAAVGERNILFGINRLNRQKFDNVVSQHLEPKLLADTVSLLKHFDNLVLVQNFDWGQGEIDLLVYSPDENSALHIQAKASLAPEGARMIRATEARIEEGLVQLAAFRRLTQEQQDTIFSNALGKSVRKVTVVDAVLARACFGTHRIWTKAIGTSFITLPLLALVLSELERRGELFSVVRFPALVNELLGNLMAAAGPRWEPETIELGSASVSVPMLRYDHSPLIQAKVLIYKVFDRNILQ